MISSAALLLLYVEHRGLTEVDSALVPRPNLDRLCLQIAGNGIFESVIKGKSHDKVRYFPSVRCGSHVMIEALMDSWDSRTCGTS